MHKHTLMVPPESPDMRGGASEEKGLAGGFVRELRLSFRSRKHAQPGCGQLERDVVW